MSLHEESLLQDEQQGDAAQCCIRPERLLHSCERGMHRRSVSARSLMCECYVCCCRHLLHHLLAQTLPT